MKGIEEVKAEPKTNKFILTIIAVIVAVSVCMIISVMFSNEKLQFEDDTIIISYPKPNDYIYKEVNQNPKTYEISNKNGDFIITIAIDNSTLENEYDGDFEKLKEMKTFDTESEDITINGVLGFGYYNEEQDQYQIILPCKETQILKVNIQPVVRFSGENAKELYKREDVKLIIDNIRIK